MSQADIKTPRVPQTVNEKLLQRTIMHQVFISRYGEGLANRIVALLEDVQTDLVGIITKRMIASGERGFDTGPMTTARFKRLFGAINETVDLHNDAAYRELRTELFALSKQEAAWQAGAVASEVPVKVDMLLPSAELLHSSVTSLPFRGKFLREWFGDLKASEKKNIQQALRIGVTEGEGIEAMVRRVIGTRANKYRDGVLQTTRNEARMVVRTAVNHVSTAARLNTNKANSNVVKAEKMVATLDQRTSSICRTLDGKVFKVGTGPRPPFHPFCRTTVVPVLKSWKEMGINLKEAPTGTRAALGGEVPEDVSYGQWFAKQDAKMQREVLGSTRYKLFKSGKWRGDVTRFSDRHGKLYTLDELKLREGDAFTAIGQPPPPKAPRISKVSKAARAEELRRRRRLIAEDDRLGIDTRIANYDKGKDVAAKLAAVDEVSKGERARLTKVFKHADDELWGKPAYTVDAAGARHYRPGGEVRGKADLESDARQKLINAQDAFEERAGVARKKFAQRLEREGNPDWALYRTWQESDEGKAWDWERSSENALLSKKLATARAEMVDWSNKRNVAEKALKEHQLKTNMHARAIMTDDFGKGNKRSGKLNGTIPPSEVEESDRYPRHEIREAEGFVNSLLPDRLWAPNPNAEMIADRTSYYFEYRKTRNDKTRASANYAKGGDSAYIKLGKFEQARVVVHEMGHHVDFRLPNRHPHRELGLTNISVSFRDMRIRKSAHPDEVFPDGTIKSPTKLKKIFPESNYRDDEVAWRDDFAKGMGDDRPSSGYYTGKFYPDGSTEIISMGLERVYQDPIYFAREDPEYFKFILGVADGTFR